MFGEELAGLEVGELAVSGFGFEGANDALAKFAAMLFVGRYRFEDVDHRLRQRDSGLAPLLGVE